LQDRLPVVLIALSLGQVQLQAKTTQNLDAVVSCGNKRMI